MQLGTRWTSGDEPPRAVPEALAAGIRSVDASISDDPRPRWTLTWLEGKPIADLDTGVTVTLGADGNAVIAYEEDDAER